MSWKEWYDSLVKPAWTPEPGTIGLVWQILYPICPLNTTERSADLTPAYFAFIRLTPNTK